MSKTILVLINGHAGVGKDTFVGFCREWAESESKCRVYNFHRSDAPKDALRYLGWDGKKDDPTRKLLKDMVDYMESKGLLNRFLQDELRASISVNTMVDSVMFYHVRDPEVMYELMDIYTSQTDMNVKPISVLITRDLEHPIEPSDWWGDLEKADYTMTIKLPNDLQKTEKVAIDFMEFLLSDSWRVVKQEDATWITTI